MRLLARRIRWWSKRMFREMITLFQVNGAMIYVDPDGKVLGYEDVFTKIDLCRRHFSAVGLGESYVDQFLR